MFVEVNTTMCHTIPQDGVCADAMIADCESRWGCPNQPGRSVSYGDCKCSPTKWGDQCLTCPNGK